LLPNSTGACAAQSFAVGLAAKTQAIGPTREFAVWIAFCNFPVLRRFAAGVQNGTIAGCDFPSFKSFKIPGRVIYFKL
jgi:hypothetical protein